MSVTAQTFETTSGEGDNTRIHYVMMSGGRKLGEGDCVIDGRLTAEDIETIRTFLAANGGFRPDEAGVPDLIERMPLSWTPAGDEVHTITKISYTNSRPTAGSLDAAQFAYCFEELQASRSLAM